MGQDTITFRRPFEAHVHGRQGALLKAVAPMTARQFWGAIFEPNLQTPITTSQLARSYRQEIVDAAEDDEFKPYVLAYFTDTIDPDELSKGISDGDILGLKFYPRGATTNSDSGVADVTTLWTPGTRQYETIRAVHANKAVVQLHCELNFDLAGNELDPYDKEDYFFDAIMPRLLDAHPDGQFSCEHLTTEKGVGFLRKNGRVGRLGCSITPHHLLFDRRDMFRGGLRPHLFCLPVIKPTTDAIALRQLATSGLPFVYAGTDSAPHDRRKKECDCCSGGVFSAHAAIEFYAMAFDHAVPIGHFGRLFEAFMSLNGPRFYNLEPSTERCMMYRYDWTAADPIRYTENPSDMFYPLGYDPDRRKLLKISWRLAEKIRDL